MVGGRGRSVWSLGLAKKSLGFLAPRDQECAPAFSYSSLTTIAAFTSFQMVSLFNALVLRVLD